MSKSTRHYHVLAGLHGCIPDSDELYRTKQEARQGLKWIVGELRSSNNRLRGNLKQGYFELVKKTDALCDYCEISDCYESDCLKELDRFD